MDFKKGDINMSDAKKKNVPEDMRIKEICKYVGCQEKECPGFRECGIIRKIIRVVEREKETAIASKINLPPYEIEKMLEKTSTTVFKDFSGTKRINPGYALFE